MALSAAQGLRLQRIIKAALAFHRQEVRVKKTLPPPRTGVAEARAAVWRRRIGEILGRSVSGSRGYHFR
jgi:hypothetical protein